MVFLSTNPNAIDMLRANPEKINWCYLSKNPNVIDLLREILDKICWFNLSENPNAIELLRENPDKIDWDWLSANPNAINLLRENPIKYIGFGYLKIQMQSIYCEKFLIKINWPFLSKNTNPNVMHMLRANQYKINWLGLSGNPVIFELDYRKMKESKRDINQAIITEVWCPKRMARWLEQGFDLEEL